MTARTIADLFHTDPPQWGLRGDVYFWKELRESFADTPLPPTAEMLAAMLEVRIFELTGVDLFTVDPSLPMNEGAAGVYIERFDPGRGMSAGRINTVWWKVTGIPLLVDRSKATPAEA